MSHALDYVDGGAQATAAFVKFLQEASTFYGVLITGLQAAYGSVGSQLNFADQARCDPVAFLVSLHPVHFIGSSLANALR